MVVYTGKSIDAIDAVVVEEVAAVEEVLVVILIAPTTPGTVLILNIFIGIAAVPVMMLFRETVNNMLDISTDMQRLVVDVVTTVHAGGMDVAEDDIFQKPILIIPTLAAKDVVTEYAEHIMALASEEEHID